MNRARWAPRLTWLFLAAGGAVLPARGASAPLAAPPPGSAAAASQSEKHAPSPTPRPVTLDTELSRAALRLLEQAHPMSGGAVAVEANTGKILVWAEMRRDGVQRSVIGEATAPAASVFKLVTTATLFELGGVTPRDRVCISGGTKSIERRHLEPPRHGAGSCGPFGHALGFSRNAVYAQLATRRLTRQDLIDVAERLGFNSSVPFDWPVPVGRLTVPYNDLEFARTAAGFENSTLSPLGGAYLASVIAQGGVGRRFHMVEAPLTTSDEAEPAERVLSPTTARRMTHMMELTVSSGTARRAFSDGAQRSYLPGIRVAGKTGTLRPGAQSETASWFVGFAPSDHPEIIVSVMLENGAVWRQRAAEVARDLLRVYFHRKGAANVTDPFADNEAARSKR